MLSLEVERGTHGRYGTAVRQAKKPHGFLAWGCLGNTVGNGPLLEDGETWLQFGETAAQALEKLSAELDRLPS